MQGQSPVQGMMPGYIPGYAYIPSVRSLFHTRAHFGNVVVRTFFGNPLETCGDWWRSLREQFFGNYLSVRVFRDSFKPWEGGGWDEREWHVVVVWEDLLSNRRVRQLSLMEEGCLCNGFLKYFLLVTVVECRRDWKEVLWVVVSNNYGYQGAGRRKIEIRSFEHWECLVARWRARWRTTTTTRVADFTKQRGSICWIRRILWAIGVILSTKYSRRCCE